MTIRWVLYDEATATSWTMPLNPDQMVIPARGKQLVHSIGRYGVTSIEQTPRDRELTWGGVIRSQAHYDQLVLWAEKENVVRVTDHVGRQWRVYITEFNPTDRSPIPSAPKRWRYTMKSKLLEEL